MDLGLVNTREMLENAYKEGYAVPGYNFNNMEQLQAIMKACSETRSPVILQVSKGAREYANQTLLRYMAMGAVKMVRELGSHIPVALHLDHGDSFELCKACVDNGFSSVMIDGSFLPYEENVALTRKVVEYAHQFDVTVEGELGVLAGIEEEVSAEKSHYTNPKEVKDFVEKTGVDSLAISIGTSHGAYKFKLKPGEPLPTLRFDILEEVARRLPGFPIVLHGASSILPKYVQIINEFGGNLEGAVGIPEDQLRKAAQSAVCKINIDSDGRLVFTAIVRKYLAENPKEFDPRKYLGAARKELIEMIKQKNIDVLGSAWRA
ncbi:MAG: class II fructose-bisphosphate aldolase [Candidatus Bathyarchaeia archaeon]